MTSTSELFGIPVAVLALIIAAISLAVALSTLIWQIVKHLLDGGRVRVRLNVGILQPRAQLSVNQNGRFVMQDPGRTGLLRRNIEVAQLVVENPGRSAVTIHGPTLDIRGVSKKPYSVSPRRFPWDGDGHDDAEMKSSVRLDPYSRAVFLLDFWSVIPDLHGQAAGDAIYLRGMVHVGGRRRPRKSSRRRSWKIPVGAWTVSSASDKIDPYTVMWREVYRSYGLASQSDGWEGPDFESLEAVIYETARHLGGRPSRDQLSDALERAAQHLHVDFDALPMMAFQIDNALDLHGEHLGAWPLSSRLPSTHTE
ncbi:hypothetical protein [Streptomyces sp. NPDC058612]|uniref:hypothetical protein n=1 Tax=Streptomyces sp. NPDC058612 TaxID=3346555 RepID=UPI00366594AD